MSNRIQSLALVVLGVPVLAFGLAAVTANADTIYVCWDGSGDYLTIQEGIDAADGDEVVVCDGTYTGPLNKNLDFGGKLITLRSANGPDNCIIDCEHNGRGFHFHSGETNEAVVEGFTITNGIASCGAGMRNDDSSPTVVNCTFTGNSAAGGGGIYNYGSTGPTLTNCTFSGNTGSFGGGMCTYGSPTVSNCTFSGNWASSGAGMYIISSSPTVSNCTITGNTGGSAGGGLFCRDSRPTLTNCILWNNSPQEIYVHSGSLTVTYCDIQGGWAGEGNIDADPLFASGPLGDYYLSQTAAGQDEDSPCVDAGSDTAENLGLDDRTTRTDQVPDSGIVDMGYHYPIVCLGDLDGDGKTDQADLGILLADWGCDDPVNGCAGDLNGDDKTDQADLGILLADWGCGT